MKFRKLASPLTAFGLVLVIGGAALEDRSAARPNDFPGTDANITRLTTSILEHSQFAHHPFDAALASVLLDRFLDSLDGSRSLFLQTDAAEFAAHPASLAADTREKGDARAAEAIFSRYLERLQQRAAYASALLKTANFDFTGHDVYSFDREHAPRPADVTAAEALWRQQVRADYLQEKLNGKAPERIASTLNHRYAAQLQTMKALGPDDVLALYLDTLAHVYDPHSDYLGHEQMESFSIGMNLSLFGIGATLEDVDGYCTIRDLVPGGPAARTGQLKPGDRIVAVAQASKEPVDVVNMPLSQAVELIRGPKATTVTLKVLPATAADGSPLRSVSIVRDEVKLEDQEAKARIVDLPVARNRTLRLGVIDLPSFYNGQEDAARRSATADVARLLGKLQAEHVEGILLDLRRNGGGSLDEAISLTGLFIRTGPVVQTRGPSGDIAVGADTDPGVAYDGPLVLLTSRFSASATEILAGALQDYGRALVVGDSSTFGKGTVQSIMPLGKIMDRIGLLHAFDPGALKVTINKFYRPSGASTQLRGVASDIVLPSTSDFSQVSESALKAPLPWDVVPPASYTRLDRVRPYLADLRQDSARRVAADEDFTELRGDIARLKHNLDTKSISLNETERRRDLAQAKTREEERKREDRALDARRPTTYAITLENASSPGLPPPLALQKDNDDASLADPSSADAWGEATGERASAHDIILNEGEQILADYVTLTAHSNAKTSLATK